MLGKVSRRAIDLGVLFLALYAFAFLPLGERTGLEHLQAVLATGAAKDAGRDLLTAAERLRRKLLGRAADEPVPGRGAPVVPKLPRGPEAAPNVAIAPAASPRPMGEAWPRVHDGPDASQ